MGDTCCILIVLLRLNYYTLQWRRSSVNATGRGSIGCSQRISSCPTGHLSSRTGFDVCRSGTMLLRSCLNHQRRSYTGKFLDFLDPTNLSNHTVNANSASPSAVTRGRGCHRGVRVTSRGLTWTLKTVVKPEAREKCSRCPATRCLHQKDLSREFSCISLHPQCVFYVVVSLRLDEPDPDLRVSSCVQLHSWTKCG